MGAIVPCCLPRPDWRLQRWSPPRVKPIDAPRRTSAPWTPPPICYWLKSPLPRPNVDAQRPPSPANDRRDSSAIANSFPRDGPPIKAPPPHLMRAGLGPPPIRGLPPHLVRDGLGQPPIKAPPAHLVRAGLGPLPIKAPPPHWVRAAPGPLPLKAPPPHLGKAGPGPLLIKAPPPHLVRFLLSQAFQSWRRRCTW